MEDILRTHASMPIDGQIIHLKSVYLLQIRKGLQYGFVLGRRGDKMRIFFPVAQKISAQGHIDALRSPRGKDDFIRRDAQPIGNAFLCRFDSLLRLPSV